MDFAAQLAALEQSANAARNRRPSPGRNSNPRPRQRPRHDPNSNPLERLQKLGFRFDYKAEKTTDRNRPPHLCFLAITIDELPYLDIWKAYWEKADFFVSLVCHAKYPQKVQNEFLKSHLILEPPKLGRGNTWADPVPRTHTPKWGSIEIVRAMKDVLSQGLQIGLDEPEGSDMPDHYSVSRYVITKPTDKIPPVDKFVYISETCLPIETFARTKLALFGEPETDVKRAGDTSSNEAKLSDEPKVTGDTEKSPEDNETNEADATKEIDEKADSPEKASASIEDTQTQSAEAANSEQVDLWDVSWVNARNQNMPGTPRNLYEKDQFAKIRNIAGIFRWKADQWLALSRPHAEAVHNIDRHLPVGRQLWRSFSYISASDEMYFPTALAMLGYLKEGESKVVVKRPVTYTDWTEGMKNPKSHTAKDLKHVVKVARAQGCLFARKFEGPITVEEWKVALGQQP